MKVIGLDGKQYTWNLTNHTPLESDDRERSSFHKLARPLIKKVWDCCRILEEVHLPGSGGLYCDFYVPMVKQMIEIHGRQHYEYVPFFHGSYLGFSDSLKRDRDKKEWCFLNKISLVVLPYNRVEDWEFILDGRLSE